MIAETKVRKNGEMPFHMPDVAQGAKPFMKEHTKMADNDDKVLTALGQIQGELKGIRELMYAHNKALQQRINDFATANETRFKNVESRLNTLEEGHKSLLIRTAAGGGISGGIVAVAVQLIKMHFGG